MVSLLKNNQGTFGSRDSFTDQPHRSLTDSPTIADDGLYDSPRDHLIPPSQSAGYYHQQTNEVKRFPSTWAIVLQAFLLILLEVLAFVLSDVLHVELLGGIDPPFALLTILHVVVWSFMLLIERYLHRQHHAMRSLGYLNFFANTKDIRRVSTLVLGVGHSALLILVSFMLQVDQFPLTLLEIFQIVVSIEVAICIISIVIHLHRVTKFNALQSLPDVYQQDLVGGFQSNMYATPEIGYRDGDGVDDVVEKQAEMIRYLQQHNANLGRRIVQLTRLASSSPPPTVATVTPHVPMHRQTSRVARVVPAASPPQQL